MEFIGTLQRIERNLYNLHNRQENVTYQIDPPCAIIEMADGKVFKVLPGGQSFRRIGGLDLPLPKSECPYPEAIWRLDALVWYNRHKKHLPLALMSVAALASLQVFLCLIPGAPGVAWFIDYFAAAMNAVLITLAAGCIVAAFIWNFERGRQFHWGDSTDAPLLTAGHLDISPDVLIVSTSDTEQPDTFAQRVRDATLEQLPSGQYLLILTYRCPAGIIVRCPDLSGQSQEYFERANLTRTIPGWTQEVCEPMRFDRETWAEFSAYVRAFCEQFRVWSQTDKMKQGANPLKSFVETMEATAKKAAVIIAVLLCSLSAYTQSARPLPQSAGQSVFSGALPDSVKIEQMKLSLIQGKSAVAQETKPTRAFSMWFFHRFVLPVFALIAIILWIVAKSAFKESEHDFGGNVIFGIGIADRGHWARRGIWVILTLTAIIEMAAVIIDDILTKENLWGRFFLWVFYAFVAYFLITWLTPNPKKATPTPQGQGGISFPTTRQLHG